jgi:hypothetical protein
VNRTGQRKDQQHGAGSARRRAVLRVSGALLLAAVFLTLWPTLLSGRSRRTEIERVSQLPPEFIGDVVRQGRFYEAVFASNELVIRTFSAADGKAGVLARLNLEGRALNAVYVTDTDYLVLTAPRQDNLAPSYQRQGQITLRGKPIPIIFGRRAMDPPLPLGPGETRVTLPREIAHDSRSTLLHRIPLDGGPVQQTILDTQNHLVSSTPNALTEEGVFWILPRSSKRTVVVTEVPPRKGVAIPGPQTDYATEEMPLVDDLMFSPADGDKARVWRHGVHSRMRLSTSGDGLYLGDDREERTRDGKVTRIRETMRISLTNATAPPVTLTKTIGDYLPLERDGRLYWKETYFLTEDRQPGQTPPQSGRVVTCRTDGTDRRILWEGRDDQGEPQTLGPLFFHQGKLYIVYGPAGLPRTNAPGNISAAAKAPPVDSGYRVACLHPERANALGASFALPPGLTGRDIPIGGPPNGMPTQGKSGYADNGYLYAAAWEQKRSGLDFLYSQTTERNICVLYRVRLPQ